jgi:hypothetical protein
MEKWPISEPYLILHKVRGERAFDIAVQMEAECESDPGPWWIILTSGHRAYPRMEWPIRDLLWSPTTYDPPISVLAVADSCGTDDLRDHYENDSIHLRDTTPTQITSDILALIGAAKPQPSVTRRR